MKKIEAAVIVLAVALASAVTFDILLYNSNQQLGPNYNALNQSYNNLSQRYENLSLTYNSIFNYSLSNSINPPISRLQAIGKALDFARIQNMTLSEGHTVQADLVFANITQSNGEAYFESGPVVTSPASNYSAVTIGNTTYYYAWYVNIPLSESDGSHYGFACFIEASTGDFISP